MYIICVGMCVYMYMHVRVYLNICMYIGVHVCVCVYACVYLYVCGECCVRVYVRMSSYIWLCVKAIGPV